MLTKNERTLKEIRSKSKWISGFFKLWNNKQFDKDIEEEDAEWVLKKTVVMVRLVYGVTKLYKEWVESMGVKK